MPGTTIDRGLVAWYYHSQRFSKLVRSPNKSHVTHISVKTVVRKIDGFSALKNFMKLSVFYVRKYYFYLFGNSKEKPICLLPNINFSN